jgi:branched-chain amino acid transport system substrate-binding protein
MQVQAKSAGYDFKFLGTDGWDTDVLLDIGGSALDGCVFVTFFDYELNADNPKVQEVLALYQEVTGAAPRSSYGAMCMDAYNVLLDAMEACNSTDGPTLRDAIAATDKEYATGYYKFDENGDADVDTCYLRSCKDGKFVGGGSVKMH